MRREGGRTGERNGLAGIKYKFLREWDYSEGCIYGVRIRRG